MIQEQDIKSHADEIAYSHQEDAIEAENLLREIVKANRAPNYAELVFFDRRMGWDSMAVKRERRRVAERLRLEAIAGSPADRKAAEQEAATAAQVLATEGPKSREKIEKEQAKLSGWERDAKLSAKRCEEQSDAVARMRELVPKYIADEVRNRRNAIESSLGREILDAEVRQIELTCCLDRSRFPSDQRGEQTYLEQLHRSFRPAVNVGLQGRYTVRTLSSSWPAIRSEIESELAELNAKLPKLREQFEAELIEIEKPLDFYAAGPTE